MTIAHLYTERTAIIFVPNGRLQRALESAAVGECDASWDIQRFRSARDVVFNFLGKATARLAWSQASPFGGFNVLRPGRSRGQLPVPPQELNRCRREGKPGSTKFDTSRARAACRHYFAKRRSFYGKYYVTTIGNAHRV